MTSETEMERIERDVLARYVLGLAREVEDDYRANVSAGRRGQYDVEWDWPTADDVIHVETGIEDDDGHYGIRVGCDVEGTYSVQTSRGSHWHPPEYRTEEVPIGVQIDFYPNRHGDGFAGADIYVERL